MAEMLNIRIKILRINILKRILFKNKINKITVRMYYTISKFISFNEEFF